MLSVDGATNKDGAAFVVFCAVRQSTSRYKDDIDAFAAIVAVYD